LVDGFFKHKLLLVDGDPPCTETSDQKGEQDVTTTGSDCIAKDKYVATNIT
jgi:hypothetical protein